MNMNLEWLSDPTVFGVGREEAHSYHRFAKSLDELYGENTWIKSLNGMWKMFYAKNLSMIPKGFEKVDFDIAGFDEVQVPLSIQMQGYDHTSYFNYIYPWDGHESLKRGEIPQEFNPTACYVKEFTVDKAWKGQKVLISFQGAESALSLWVNGHFIGYTEDSFTAHDFDITKYVAYDKVNRLSACVYRFCSGSWLEDQDFFRFSGIFRDVYLYTVPSVHVRDMFAKSVLNKDNASAALSLELSLDGTEKASVFAELLDDNGVVKSFEVSGTVNKSGVIRKKIEIKDIKPWSAEYPNLYELRLTVKDEAGKTTEYVSQKIGFKRFEIEDGVLKLNGKRIVFNGVNRHEMSCITGRTVSYEDTRNDIINMKRNNINAIRTCHYPDRKFFYDLCDEFGIYVICECNLETHGTWATKGKPDADTLPGSTATWRDVVLDRARSMQESEKNHASIVFWSCGNESCGGKNIYLMSQLFKKRDDTRLVHYEGICHDRTYNDTSDVESMMYPKPWDCVKIVNEWTKKPFILCEYAHSMGNSTGNLSEYTDLFHEIDRFQGGFIWDYIDQAFLKKNRYGEEFMGYGSDFGDPLNDYNFCGDGIVFADRTNSPKMQEVKHCYQNIRVDVKGTKAKITNYSLFTNTDEFDCVVYLFRNGDLVAAKSVLVSVAPGETGEIECFAKQKEKGEYSTVVSFALAEDCSWADAGYEIAFGQDSYVVGTKCAGRDMLVAELEKSGRICDESVIKNRPRVVRGDYNFTFRGDAFRYEFTGMGKGFISMKTNEKELFALEPKPNFWRCPTDNDVANRMPVRYGQWKLASQYSGARFVDVKKNGNSQKVTFDHWVGGFGKDCKVKSSYEIDANGIIKVSLDYEPFEGATEMPEFGMMFVLPFDYNRVTYYGLGPDENYCDRYSGAKLAIHSFDVADNVTPYLMPQECGNRTGVRFAKIMDEKGHGMLIAGNSLELSVLPYSPYELENAKHYYELPNPTKTFVRVSLKQMGVGGDDTWGARTHDPYLIDATKPLHLEFFMAGF